MRTIILIFIILIGSITLSVRTVVAFDERKPKDDEVGIHFSGVEVPLNRIILIRKNSEYCAIKFDKHWAELDQERFKKYKSFVSKEEFDHKKDHSTKKYADYEGYYQSDGSGSFVKSNVKVTRETAIWLPPKGFMRPFIYNPGNPYVECGPYKLGWQYKTFVAVIQKSSRNLGDYGFEFAPTPWTDIKEVNVFDPRVKWYRYDEKRERVFIPIDKLWEPAEKKEK